MVHCSMKMVILVYLSRYVTLLHENDDTGVPIKVCYTHYEIDNGVQSTANVLCLCILLFM